MMNSLPEKSVNPENKEERLPYESPAIIFEGPISTRAGSPNIVDPAVDGVDPEDIFGDY